MPFIESNAVAWLVLGAFGGAIVSAIVPWVNAEILLLSAVAIRRDATIPLVIAVALGQMIGKSVLYWLARSARVPHAERFTTAVEQWRARFQGHPLSAVLIMGVSAVTGFPPFYIISLVAGAMRISFVAFLIVGSLGRLAHFALFALVPHVASRWF